MNENNNENNFDEIKNENNIEENIVEEETVIEEKESVASIIWSYIKVIVFAVAISFAVRYFVFSTTLVDGMSMYPTVFTGDRLVVNKIFFMKKNITRGDVIDFYVPDADKYYLKRVIGVEGDTVEIIGNRVFLNGKQLKETYVSSDETEPHSQTTKWTVPENSVFVLGDNRPNSRDGRDLGVISRDNIVGKIVLRFYPLNRFGGLD